MSILHHYTAGNPMKEGMFWTNLSISRISELLKEKGLNVGRHVVKPVMKQLGYVQRKLVKSKILSVVANRDEQFRQIANLQREFIDSGLPVLSIDSKKKEMMGNFYRDGYLYTQQPIAVNDHDFQSFSDGSVVPHGIYDVYQNICYLTLGQSKDTAEFVYDNLLYYWENYIKYHST